MELWLKLGGRSDVGIDSSNNLAVDHLSKAL